ncbi:MAG: RluA family pseudouridine synthase [Clostridia bacterium]|nr:RluA family pseudouridine synthase [Clostridia bacterium]
MRQVSLTVEEQYAGQRLDKFLSLEGGVSRSLAAKLAEDGAVSVNGRVQNKKYLLHAGETVTFTEPDPELCEAKPEDIPLDIVYEDDWLLVVNKPRGMVVHPAAGNPDGTLVSALLHHCGDSLSGINGVLRPGIVHRIDTDTSGLLIVAKNDEAHRKLAEQIAVHSFLRRYEAVVIGRMPQQTGTVNAPIGRSKTDRKKMAVTQFNSKPAVTHYEVLTEYQGYSHLRLRLETGRTHQIRVHLSSLGHPVAGDPVYGGTVRGLDLGGQVLHAKTIGFIHPADGRYLEFDSELPPYFTQFLQRLEERR